MFKDKILNLLRTSHNGFLSGEELARKCGISRTMVWKHIKALETEGYGIEAVPSQGYRIISEPDIIRRADLLRGLKANVIGKELQLLQQTGSTNTLAMELASHGAREGTVIVAETQNAGKGRLGRTWVSPKGNLYFSVILRPNIPLQKAPLLTLLAAVSIASVLKKACGIPAGIKWPNDILVQGKKISGILLEMSADQDGVRHVVLGIGINVNMDRASLPPQIRDSVTTLAEEKERKQDRTLLLRTIFEQLNRSYAAFLHGPESILEEWRELNVTIGKNVAVRSMEELIEGEAVDIDQEGRLLIRMADGMVRSIASGDVSLRADQNSNSSPPQ